MAFKVTKMTFDLIDEKGRKFQKSLEGADAEEWHENNVELCLMAEEMNMNSKWHQLPWKLIEVKPESKLMDEILKNK